MNILHALTHLGYTNTDDFVVDWDENSNAFVITEWLHADTQPSTAALQTAWDEWYAINGPSLDVIKEDAKYQIDSIAERVRLQFVTPGSAQAMVYQEKGDEAADFAAAGYPADLSAYPFIQAEVNVTGQTATQAADDILAQKAAWIAIGVAIEEARLGGKNNVDAAVDEAGVASAEAVAIAALEAI